MRWMARYFTPPILLGLSLTSVSIALLYVLYRKDEEDTKSRKSQVEISKRYTIECSVPRQFVPAVIGRGGSMIKDIQNKTGTLVHFKEDNIECPERICVIKGSYESVYLAENMIKSIIHNQPIIESYVLPVPQKACGRIIGRGGDVIHHIQTVSGAKVTIESAFVASEPFVERKITIKGTSKQINTALELIQEKIYEEEEERTKLQASSAARLPRGKLSPRNTINSSEQGQNTESLTLPVSDGFIEVYVSAVETPSQFWVQIVGPGITALDKLVSDMNAYYSNKENYEMHKLKSIEVGQLVAAKFSFNKQWYRAEVISLPSNDQCEVFYLDYGDHEIVHHNCVLELRTDFLSLRLQAIECSLANVKPPGAEWSNDECDFFAEITFLAEWKVLYAKVKGFKERTFGYGRSRREGSPIPSVELYNKHENEEINIGCEMIKEGYAELEETAPSTASSTLSLFSRHYDVGSVSTPPLTKRALSPETSANSSRNLDSAIDSPSTSTMDGMPTDVSDVLSSEVKEVHLFTPHKPHDWTEEVDLMASKKEMNRFVANEKKVQQDDDYSVRPPNGTYIPLESTQKRERPWQVSKFSRVAPAGFESDMSDDSDVMELG
ncbi:tudor and KH domain-containing protein homolog [Bombus huntii]|uniref:tudor and KH domain-containing protein homolog n=1 Tax=Bombus huntii TaxID=85661 RepID=UPI0021AAAA76|nr:tudor and KH domain-containing protein homolog [Bombus huntii]